MNRLLILPVLLLTLLVGTPPAFSADYQKGLTAYDGGDYATALREWTPLAEQGDVRAQTFLGFMYDQGLGVPQDYKTAVKWYTFAAKTGDAGKQYHRYMRLTAQYNLGLMYDEGRGVIQDYVRAHMWFNIAASSGDKDMVKKRDIVAGKMTPSQLEKSQNLARECVRKNYKEC